MRVFERLWQPGRRFAAAGLALAACAPKPPVPEVIERERTYPVGREVAGQRVLGALQTAGFAPGESADGRIETSLTYQDARSWARCDRPMVNERGGDRRQLARPLDRTARVTVLIEGDQSMSRVEVATEIEARMLNGFINREIDVPCRSTGRLERLVLDAVPA